MRDKIVRGVKVALVIYVVVAVIIDPFLFRIPWGHALTDGLTIGAAILFGLFAGVFKSRR